MADPPNHFFKFIPPGFNFNLSIPKSFLLNLDGWRSKKAILRRGCHKWPVDISDGGVFGDGWRKFVVDNGVQELDFIVFKHHGNMVFDLFVFDPSTCERQYQNLLDEVEDSLPEYDSLHPDNCSYEVRKIKQINYQKNAYTSSSSGRSKEYLYLPAEFSRSNGLRMGEMILRDDNGRSWKVQLNKLGENRLYIGRGFRDFVIGNRLREGDAYKFELLENEKDKPPVVNFSFLGKKAIKDHIQLQETSSKIKKVTGSTLVKKENGKPPIMKETSKMLNKRKRTDYLSQISKHELQLDEDCCFLTIMTPNHIKEARLNVPMKLARSNGLTTRRMPTQVILVDEAKSTWPATLHMKYGIRLAGWHNLIIANDLKAGDTCMFKLVKSGEVPVFTFYKLGKKPTNNNSQVKKETSSAIQKATSSTRYYTSTLNPYSCERSILYLPAEFSISNGLRTGETILRDDKGRSWKVQLNKLGENRFYLGCGFRDFLFANGLREGDTYKFELVENKKDKPPVMNFSYLGKMAGKKHIHLHENSSTIKKLIGTTLVKKKGMPQIMKGD
ncbi:B3 domain-containing protein REM14-like [Bidens hawaiensis]|uniref:B3 domain-containing protein REM14-like n=1 Tax=Bidens hawaiensis TaxID=980011 RepID=UPI00404A7392